MLLSFQLQKKFGSKRSSHYEAIVCFSDGSWYRMDCGIEDHGLISVRFKFDASQVPTVVEKAIAAHQRVAERKQKSQRSQIEGYELSKRRSASEIDRSLLSGNEQGIKANTEFLQPGWVKETPILNEINSTADIPRYVRYCRHCGVKLQEESKYCFHYGTKIEGNSIDELPEM